MNTKIIIKDFKWQQVKKEDAVPQFLFVYFMVNGDNDLKSLELFNLDFLMFLPFYKSYKRGIVKFLLDTETDLAAHNYQYFIKYVGGYMFEWHNFIKESDFKTLELSDAKELQELYCIYVRGLFLNELLGSSLLFYNSFCREMRPIVLG